MINTNQRLVLDRSGLVPGGSKAFVPDEFRCAVTVDIEQTPDVVDW
jgi:hypothetical protein